MINRKNIRLIIVLMVLALSGLVAIQIYWIKNAFELEKQRFENTVVTALQNVVEHVEKQEVAQSVRKRFDASRQGKQFFLGIDSLIRKNINRKDTTTSGIVYWNEISPGELQTEIRQLSQDGTFETIEENRIDSAGKVQVKKIRKAKQTNGSTFISDAGTSFNSLDRPTDPRLERMMKKSSMVSDIFKELSNLNMNQGVEDRINPGIIDSLLKIEFAAAGITLNYEFGIYDFINNKLFVDHPTDYTTDLMKTPFRMRLFPHDILSHPGYLMIYFPKQDTYVFNNLWVMFASSGFFILIITGTFYFTINTIIRQKKLSDIKNDFINNMTHELKTPISTISLACEALRDPDITKSPKMAENYARIIGEENKRLGKLVENVLQSALLEQSDLGLRVLEVDLHELIRHVLTSLTMILESKKVKLELKLNAKHFLVDGDPDHLANMIFNLIDNAVKYSPDSPEIAIETTNQADKVVLQITDNGIGISRDQQKKVFEKLYRVPTGNIHNVKGFGLGLSYVKSIVEKHQGQVKIESEPGVGSRFIVSLPNRK
jgi:two-component system phosphate regulon sensor histidine kinase PhoR